MNNTIYIYTNKCLRCGDNDRLKHVKDFAKEHGLVYVSKPTYIFPELKAEAAELSGLKMPFVYYNGKSVPFYGVESNLIKKALILDELLG